MAEIKSLEQKRAKLAWEFVQFVKDNRRDKQKEFKSVMRKLPAMILTSGLAQTIAFHLGKDIGKPEHEVIDNLAIALSELTDYFKGKTAKELQIALNDEDHEVHIMLTREALKYATWLKRLAEAELEE